MLFSCIGSFFFLYLLGYSGSLCSQVPDVLLYSMYMFPPQACVGDVPALHRISNVPHCELCLCLQIHKARFSRLLFRGAFLRSAYNQVKLPPRALSGFFFSAA